MAIIVATLGISISCYLFGALYSPRAVDYREERTSEGSKDEVCWLPVMPLWTVTTVVLHEYVVRPHFLIWCLLFMKFARWLCFDHFNCRSDKQRLCFSLQEAHKVES